MPQHDQSRPPNQQHPDTARIAVLVRHHYVNVLLPLPANNDLSHQDCTVGLPQRLPLLIVAPMVLRNEHCLWQCTAHQRVPPVQPLHHCAPYQVDRRDPTVQLTRDLDQTQ